VLRAARADDPADPRRAAEALEELAPLRSRLIPRLLGQGHAAGASWSTESVLPGHRPARLSPAVKRELGDLFASMPRAELPASAHTRDLASLADRFPRWATLLSEVAEELDRVASAVPSVIRHGDLWAGNILVRRGRLSGIIDWDAWHPSALPGIDLLHLVATDKAMRRKWGVGQTWLGRPWESAEYGSTAAEYWRRTRIVPNPRLLSAVGMAWWAAHVEATTRRKPRLVDNERWVRDNVDRVLETLGRN
jgi:Phosphotransferase enzyme family